MGNAWVEKVRTKWEAMKKKNPSASWKQALQACKSSGGSEPTKSVMTKPKGAKGHHEDNYHRHQHKAEDRATEHRDAPMNEDEDDEVFTYF